MAKVFLPTDYTEWVSIMSTANISSSSTFNLIWVFLLLIFVGKSWVDVSLSISLNPLYLEIFETSPHCVFQWKLCIVNKNKEQWKKFSICWSALNFMFDNIRICCKSVEKDRHTQAIRWWGIPSGCTSSSQPGCFCHTCHNRLYSLGMDTVLCLFCIQVSKVLIVGFSKSQLLILATWYHQKSDTQTTAFTFISKSRIVSSIMLIIRILIIILFFFFQCAILVITCIWWRLHEENIFSAPSCGNYDSHVQQLFHDCWRRLGLYHWGWTTAGGAPAWTIRLVCPLDGAAEWDKELLL